MKKKFKTCKFVQITETSWACQSTGNNLASVADILWVNAHKEWAMVSYQDVYFSFQAMLDITEFMAQLKDAQL